MTPTYIFESKKTTTGGEITYDGLKIKMSTV